MTPADEAVESATDGAVESATDEASEVELQPEGGADPGEDLASETEEPLEIEPIQREDIEEILIQGQVGTGIPESAPISVI